MTHFKELVTEIYNTDQKIPGDFYERFKEKNEKRVGKTVVNNEGNEIKDSIVLTVSSFAMKTKEGVDIMGINMFDEKMTRTSLTKDELKILKKL